MWLDIEGPLAAQAKAALTERIAALNSDEIEDPGYVAEFVVVLILNDATPDSIASELNLLFDNAIPMALIQEVYTALEQAVAAGQASVEVPAAAPAPAPSAFDAPAPSAFDTPAPSAFDTPAPSAFPLAPRNAPTGPRNALAGPRNARGIAKPNSRAHPSSRALDATLRGPAASRANRCPDFPNCPKGRDCDKAHPTRPCFAFPDCPNPPGTCNYLHPGEDDELIAELERRKAANQEKRALRAPGGGIALCKFGAVCQREECPFAHPTPANAAAKVLELVWCPSGKECVDEGCSKLHPLPGYTPPAKKAYEPVERTLEQCKYGANCTARNCPKRHATLPVLCRDGAECQRIDCFFLHPIPEPCRFGVNCRNKFCAFQHPPERAETLLKPLVWTKAERVFAEDQPMEQAPAQE